MPEYDILNLPKKLMTCDKFDAYTAKKVLILPNQAFSMFDSPEYAKSTDDLVNIAKKKIGDDAWVIVGRMGDFSAGSKFVSMKKGMIGTFGTFKSVVVASQSRVSPAKISDARKSACGLP
jgi:hypothetical protein